MRGRHGDGTVRWRGDTWEARLVVASKRRSFYGRTEQAARAKMEEARLRYSPPAPGHRLQVCRGYHVYLCQGALGAVLYVGQTSDPWRRLGDHAVGAGWWQEVVEVSLMCAPDRQAALAEERRLIRLLQPRYNVMGLAG